MTPFDGLAVLRCHRLAIGWTRAPSTLVQWHSTTNQRGIRFSAHLVFDPPVREFFTKASQCLVVAEPLRPASWGQ